MSIAHPPLDSRRQRRQLLGLLGLLVFVVTLLLTYQLWLSYQEKIDVAKTTTRNYAAIFEARLDASLRRTDTVLLALSRTIPAAAMSKQAVPGFAEVLNAELDSRMLNFKELAGLRIFDASGELLYTSDHEKTKRVNVLDHRYFALVRDKPQAGLVFSEVLTARTTGRQSIVATRALRNSQGVFLGVVNALIDVVYFQQLFEALDIGEQGLLSIRRSDDFSLVVRWPPLDSEINQALPPGSLTRQAIVAGKSEVTAEFDGVLDGVKRIFSMRKLEPYPFYVLAAQAHDDVLAGWRTNAISTGVAGLLLLGLLAALLYRLWRSEARAERVLANLTASESRLRANGERLEIFERLAEHSGQGIAMAQMDGKLSYANPALRRLLGVPLTTAPGDYSFKQFYGDEERRRLREEVVPQVLQAGQWTGEMNLCHADGQVIPALQSLFVIRDAAGAPLALANVLADLTERQQSEEHTRFLLAEMQTIFSNALVGIVHLKQRHVVSCNRRFEELFGYDAGELFGKSAEIFYDSHAAFEQVGVDAYATVAQNVSYEKELIFRRKDGSAFWGILTGRAIDPNRPHEGSIWIYADISERKAAEEKISHLAHFDALTDLPNRASLQGRLEQALASARREGGTVAVMFLDLDRFKNVNDTLGHHIGDMLLLEVAQRLASSVRESDVVARLGGDEFVVLLTGSGGMAAAHVADKIREALAQPYRIEGYQLFSSSSIGIAVSPGDGDSVGVLMQNADAAMYHAKAAGRNNVQFFTANLNEAAKNRRELENDLYLALLRKEFVLYYQPQVTAEGRVLGAEALLRWQHSVHGLVSPLKFIPMAEDTGLILPIGQWVLETACAQIKAWSTNASTRQLQVAVNVSPRQFRQANFVEQVRQVLESSAIDPRLLKLELTESLVLDNVEDTIEKMNVIKQFGVLFSMDDFGTGYSSLSYLTRLPLDQLKIDRSFVTQLPENRSDAVIAQTIVTMASSLGLQVIAEGVETTAQHEFLKEHGCHAYQGYLFSRPMPVSEFELFCQ